MCIRQYFCNLQLGHVLYFPIKFLMINTQLALMYQSTVLTDTQKNKLSGQRSAHLKPSILEILQRMSMFRISRYGLQKTVVLNGNLDT